MDSEQGITSLNRVFEPLADVLMGELNLPVFFLALNPIRWRVDYCGLSAKADSELMRVFRNNVDTIRVPKRDESSGDFIDRIAREFHERVEASFPAGAIRDVATAVLSKRAIDLGAQTNREGDTPPAHPWVVRSRQPASMKWFQYALELAHTNKEAIGSFAGDIRNALDLETWPVVGVKRYMAKDHLVHANNVEFFLSEYLYAISQKHEQSGLCDWDVRPSTLQHYFLPLEGLGQWRASACWLAPEHSRQTLPTITHAFHTSLIILCSLALIDAFIAELSETLTNVGTGLESFDVRERIGQVFSTLWFAREISFYRGSDFVFQFSRDDNGDMQVDRGTTAMHLPLLPSLENEFVVHHCQGDFNDHRIQLDLSQLPHPSPSTTVTILGFDKIVFSVPLFSSRQIENSRTLMRAGVHLQERLATLLDLHHKRGAANRTDVIEAINHQMKRALEGVAFPEAFAELETLNRQSREFPSTTAKCLTLCQLSLVVPSMFRLVTISQERQVDKMNGWFDSRKLDSWYSGGDDVLEHYVEVLSKYFAAVCWGNEKYDGVHLRVNFRSATREDILPTNNIRFEPLIRWISNSSGGALPPLALSDGEASSHIALFGVLFEPLNNAIKETKRFPKSGEPGRLYVELTDRCHEQAGEMQRAGIVVSIGNESRREQVKIPPRIAQLKRFLPFTRMATVLEGERLCGPDYDEERKRYRFWVSVMLHPQELAESTLKLMEGHQ